MVGSHSHTLHPVKKPVVSAQIVLLDPELRPLLEELGPVDADVHPVVRAVSKDFPIYLQSHL